MQDGVDSADQLYQQFVKTIRKPTRVYVWGVSLGGLVTEQLAEHANWVDGAAPMCGVVGGPLVNFDNWLEAAVAAQALLGVKLTLTGTLSPDQAKAESAELNSAILAARRDRDGGGAAKLVYLADLAGLPGKSSLFSKDGQANEIGAAAQNFAFYVHTGLKFLAEARDQFGGNPAMTHPADKAPLSSDQRATIAALHGNAEAYAAQVDAAAAPPTSSAARDRLVATGEPSGDLRVPTLTLHGVEDPLAIAANETVLHSLVAARDRTNRLEQLFVGPYGAGTHLRSWPLLLLHRRGGRTHRRARPMGAARSAAGADRDRQLPRSSARPELLLAEMAERCRQLRWWPAPSAAGRSAGSAPSRRRPGSPDATSTNRSGPTCWPAGAAG